ncbi:MAG TPA: hypothetical protein PLK77_14330 [Pyrinomonadaceae bacterium]|nr:hypothetical protein [Pyrinomonadaceae bacterium]
MNEDERSNELPISEADTTPPNPANSAVPSPGKGWQMPEPKFQQSSGYLPQGYLDKVAFEAPPPSEVSAAAATPATAPATASEPDVEPQPDLTEQLAEPAAPVVTAPVAKERSAGARIAMILLGLLAMVAFLTVFLGVIYYLFLAPQSGGSTF